MDKAWFITFEGPDKAGKSTQIQRFCAYLTQQGIAYHLTREPGGCAISEKIRDIILNPANEMDAICEAMLYAAARSAHVRSVIRPNLAQKRSVVCDRYLDSSLAYQGYGRNLGYDFIDTLNRTAVDGILPDITFLLLMDPKLAMQRAQDQPDRLELAGDAFRERVLKGYLEVHRRNPSRVVLIDASQSVEAVHAQILQAFEEKRRML